MTPAARALDRALGLYQTATAGRISPCRYVPSCSTYAREAVAAHGAARGSIHAVRRLLRCHPWGGHGYDPVPGTDPRHDDRHDPRHDPRPSAPRAARPVRRTP